VAPLNRFIFLLKYSNVLAKGNLNIMARQTILLLGLSVGLAGGLGAFAEGGPKVIEHVDVYSEPGRFGGWPANHGIWSWGDEILVGFGRGYYKNLGPTRHHIDRDKPEEHVLARSLDGGRTWTLEHPNEKNMLIPEGAGKGLHGTELPDHPPIPAVPCPGGIDFTHPDFAMTVRMNDKDSGTSRFYVSYDRGHTWSDPYLLPKWDQPGVMARTDYLVNGKHECMLFLTAAKSDNAEGRVICVETKDGGKTWEFLSYIGPEPEGFKIMPSTVRLSETELLTALRCREETWRGIETYRSEDNGKSWTYVDRTVPDLGEGNPPDMIKLRDGRVALIYGYRADPFGIRAKLSSDGGRTWSEEFHLRDDGGGRDIGYCRSVQRSDGNIVTTYYFCDDADGDRYIAGTIWDPGTK
jgi:hypothetical protein